MAQRIIVIGGSAAGMGAAGAAQIADPDARITVITNIGDVAFSPCGIPYVHGKEIDSPDALLLATKQHYVDQGFDIRYETTATAIDAKARTVTLSTGEVEHYDKLILATGWEYSPMGVPGEDLAGIYSPKSLQSAREWDPVFDQAKKAVVFDNGNPLVVEMVNAMSHRGLETVLVEELAWTMAEATDPDIMEAVEKSWDEMGVKSHYNTRILEVLDDGNGRVRGVRTDTAGVIDCDVLVVSTPKLAKIDLARQIGAKIGMAGGIVVDSSMQTSVRNVWAAGDCCEIPHGGSGVPIQGLSGSHAHSMGKVAGTNAGGGQAQYNPVYVPWGVTAGKWVIGGVSFSETLAGALGIDYIMGKGVGISRARYYPGCKPVTVKLLAEPKDLRIIGAQMIGQEGIKERADFLAMCVRMGITAHDLARMENVYCPPIGALNEPIALAAQNLLSNAKNPKNAKPAKKKAR